MREGSGEGSPPARLSHLRLHLRLQDTESSSNRWAPKVKATATSGLETAEDTPPLEWGRGAAQLRAKPLWEVISPGNRSFRL